MGPPPRPTATNDQQGFIISQDVEEEEESDVSHVSAMVIHSFVTEKGDDTQPPPVEEKDDEDDDEEKSVDDEEEKSLVHDRKKHKKLPALLMPQPGDHLALIEMRIFGESYKDMALKQRIEKLEFELEVPKVSNMKVSNITMKQRVLNIEAEATRCAW